MTVASIHTWTRSATCPPNRIGRPPILMSPTTYFFWAGTSKRARSVCSASPPLDLPELRRVGAVGRDHAGGERPAQCRPGGSANVIWGSLLRGGFPSSAQRTSSCLVGDRWAVVDPLDRRARDGPAGRQRPT